MLTDEERFLFDLRGFVVLREVLGPEQLGEVNRIIDGQELPPPGDTFADQIFSGFLSWGPAFTDLLDHERVFPIVTTLLNRPRLDRYYGIRMRAGTTGLPLHGGALEADGQSEFYHFHHGRMANGVITVSWALTDMLAGQGGFVCIPGSHKSNHPLPKSWDYRAEAVHHVPMAAGDVLVFNGAMAHGTHPWHADHERRSVMFKYAPGHLAWSKVYLDWAAELRQSLSPRQQALLEPPYCLPHHEDPTDRFVR
ncbi:phytanoyl-CoA dioxygenase family protein [Micromonospora sp. NPDC049903]|uniref:phytanoyl-CoA dioxygenase family protein n=1 Tax=Micromonospora sp. NPDC049903 TaxID=3364276 RepID=UPI0037BC3DE9